MSRDCPYLRRPGTRIRSADADFSALEETSLVRDLPYDRLEHAPLFGVVSRLIDLIESIELDEPIEGKAPLLVQPDQRRNEAFGIGVTFDDAAHVPAGRHQVQQVELDRGAWKGGADDAADPTRRQDLDRLLDHGGNKIRAARALGMSRATIYRKIHEYGIITPAS